MKKKVLHIVEAFGGGVFTFLVDLANATCDEYEVVLACSIRPQTPMDYKSYFNKKVRIIELQSGTRDISLLEDLKSFIEIKRLIKNEKPDIVHLHSSKSGFLGRMACNEKKMKVLYNPHGFSFLKQDESNIKKSIYKGLEYIAAKKCGSIIAVSKGEYEEALKLSRKSYLINNGIDITTLPKLEEKKIDINNLKICTIGRISYQKNPAMFNEIAKRLPNIKFTWIGKGEMEDILDSSNITITGWMNKNEAVKIMNDSDIFILTSLWEGLPIALLEAMYYKKLCIVTNCIGNRDVIVNDENGFIANNVNEFSDILYKVLKNEIDIEKVKKNAFNNIMEKYNFNLVAKKYSKLYRGIGKVYEYIPDKSEKENINLRDII